jgi:Rad3-related DNA helicase
MSENRITDTVGIKQRTPTVPVADGVLAREIIDTTDYLRPELPRSTSTIGTIAQIFQEEGLIAQAMNDGETFRSNAEQITYAKAVYTAMNTRENTAEILIANAAAGLGKTLGYLFPAALMAADRKEAIIVATHSIALQSQILNDAKIANKVMVASGRSPLKIAVQIGKQNFIWAERALKALSLLPETDSDDQKEARENLTLAANLLIADRAVDSPDRRVTPLTACQTFPDFELLYGELPDGVRADDICIKASADSDAVYHYQFHRGAADGAEILIVNHALLIMDSISWFRALRGAERYHIIVDEADQLPGVAEKMGNQSLPLEEIRWLAAEVPNHTVLDTWIKDAAREFEKAAKAGAKEYPTDQWSIPIEISKNATPDPTSKKMINLAKHLRVISEDLVTTAPTPRGQAFAEAIFFQITDWIDLASHKTVDEKWPKDTFAMLTWTPKLRYPCFASGRLTGASLISRFWATIGDKNPRARSMIFTSATMGISHKPGDEGGKIFHRDYAAFRNQCGMFEKKFDAKTGIDSKGAHLNTIEVEPAFYGAIDKIVTASRSAPKPFLPRGDFNEEEGRDNPLYAHHVAKMAMLQFTMAKNILCLTPAFRDIQLILEALQAHTDRTNEKIICHFTRKGEKPRTVIDAWREDAENPDIKTILIAANLWQGFNAPYLVNGVLIARLPRPPVDNRKLYLAEVYGRQIRTKQAALATPEKPAPTYKNSVSQAAANMYGQQRMHQLVSKIEQGTMRGIRGPNQRMTLYIADPRSPETVERALPQRFRADASNPPERLIFQAH